MPIFAGANQRSCSMRTWKAKGGVHPRLILTRWGFLSKVHHRQVVVRFTQSLYVLFIYIYKYVPLNFHEPVGSRSRTLLNAVFRCQLPTTITYRRSDASITLLAIYLQYSSISRQRYFKLAAAARKLSLLAELAATTSLATTVDAPPRQ